MRFNVPIRPLIGRIILLVAAGFNLFEAPGWQAAPIRSQITVVVEVLEAQTSGQTVDAFKLAFLAADKIIDNLDHPVVV